MIHRGTYDGTIYHNPVNKFCIISVKTADKEVPQEARSTRRYRDHLIRFVATGYELPRTDAVELELDGEWTKGKYGVQLQVEQWREIVPKTRDGVEGYLASGLIKGIGPATAAQIVSRFGVETLDILQNHPERLLEVKGITESKLEDIKDVVVMAYIMTGELWRDPTIPSPAYYGGILEGYRQNGLPVPELEAALKNVHDEVRQVRHFERMQEVDLFSGEKPGRKKGRHER